MQALQPHTMPSSAHDMLRDACAGPHALLESRSPMRRLAKAGLSGAELGQLLLMMQSLHRGWAIYLEKSLGQHPMAGFITPACRLRELEQDLSRLHAPLSTAVSEVTLPATPGHAVGALYVLLGSTLGGRAIGAALLGSADPAVRETRDFFVGDGAARARDWRRFLEMLECCADDPTPLADIIGGARAAFALFDQHLQTAGERMAHE